MSEDREPLWTRSGVRLRQVRSDGGRWNWLFVPGGPGLGAGSLRDLVDAVAVPGTSWLVDLPGDGSNLAGGEDPYATWPDVLLEAAQALDGVVLVGHSTGAMFALALPELERHLAGLVLVSTAPHAGWREAFGEYVARHPLPAVDEATARYEQCPGNAILRELAMASAPWNFTDAGLAAGRALLGRADYNYRAVQWADAHFDHDYQARWSPASMPALIVSGAQDNIVTQDLWRDAPGFTGANVRRRVIARGGHFPWIENPDQVRAAFAEFTELLASS